MEIGDRDKGRDRSRGRDRKMCRRSKQLNIKYSSELTIATGPTANCIDVPKKT